MTLRFESFNAAGLRDEPVWVVLQVLGLSRQQRRQSSGHGAIGMSEPSATNARSESQSVSVDNLNKITLYT